VVEISRRYIERSSVYRVGYGGLKGPVAIAQQNQDSECPNLRQSLSKGGIVLPVSIEISDSQILCRTARKGRQFLGLKRAVAIAEQDTEGAVGSVHDQEVQFAIAVDIANP
jgi:hypothetical protein